MLLYGLLTTWIWQMKSSTMTEFPWQQKTRQYWVNFYCTPLLGVVNSCLSWWWDRLQLFSCEHISNGKRFQIALCCKGFLHQAFILKSFMLTQWLLLMWWDFIFCSVLCYFNLFSLLTKLVMVMLTRWWHPRAVPLFPTLLNLHATNGIY